MSLEWADTRGRSSIFPDFLFPSPPLSLILIGQRLFPEIPMERFDPPGSDLEQSGSVGIGDENGLDGTGWGWIGSSPVRVDYDRLGSDRIGQNRSGSGRIGQDRVG